MTRWRDPTVIVAILSVIVGIYFTTRAESILQTIANNTRPQDPPSGIADKRPPGDEFPTASALIPRKEDFPTVSSLIPSKETVLVPGEVILIAGGAIQVGVRPQDTLYLAETHDRERQLAIAPSDAKDRVLNAIRRTKYHIPSDWDASRLNQEELRKYQFTPKGSAWKGESIKT